MNAAGWTTGAAISDGTVSLAVSHAAGGPVIRGPLLIVERESGATERGYLLDDQHALRGTPDIVAAMSATRLLVLGIVRGYGRAHGYRVGTDLLSWDAGDWANVKWGSIYHALRSLTDAGMLLDHDDVPGRTEYELTERGEAEYLRLLREAVRRPHTRPDQLGAALAMLPSLPRDEAVRLLGERLTALEEIRDKAATQLDGWTDPPHWSELHGLWRHTAAGGAEWTAGLIERLRAGAYGMAGEPGSPGRPGSWPSLQE